MQRASVLFHVQPGSKKHVLKNVKKVEGVEDAYISAMKNLVET
jgi:hypothetical protein